MVALPTQGATLDPREILSRWATFLGFSNPQPIEFEVPLMAGFGYKLRGKTTGVTVTVQGEREVARARQRVAGEVTLRDDWRVANSANVTAGWVEIVVVRTGPSTCQSNVTLYDPVWNLLAKIELGSALFTEDVYNTRLGQLKNTTNTWLLSPDLTQWSRSHYASKPLQTPKGIIPEEYPPNRFVNTRPYLVISPEGDLWSRAVPHLPTGLGVNPWTFTPLLSAPMEVPFVHTLLTVCHVAFFNLNEPT